MIRRRPLRRRTQRGYIEMVSAEEMERLHVEAEDLAEARSKAKGPIHEEEFERLLRLAADLQQLD